MRSVLCLLVVPFLALSGDRPTYDFLRGDVGARASAMAGSFVSMNGDPVSMFCNPAGLATLAGPQAAFGYTNHLLDINAGFAAYAQSVDGIGLFGFGVNYMDYGDFTKTDIFANDLGTFTAGDLALSLSMANPLEENLYYGVTVRYIRSTIDASSSSAIAGDAGLLYLIPGDDPITIGLVVSNAGTQTDPYVDTKEPLPLDVRIGGTVKPQHLPLQLSLNFHRLNDPADSFFERFTSFTVGGEFTLSKALRFRFGYNNERRKELKIGSSAGMAGFSLGGGLVMNKLRIDYGFTSLGSRIGSISMITVALDV